MENNKKVDELIYKTRKWNESRGIDNNDDALTIDVYLDRKYFNLDLQVDLEMESQIHLCPNEDKNKFKYLSIKNVNQKTSA